VQLAKDWPAAEKCFFGINLANFARKNSKKERYLAFVFMLRMEKTLFYEINKKIMKK
jgi:hypothetical protein